jgi:hypothetical protein
MSRAEDRRVARCGKNALLRQPGGVEGFDSRRVVAHREGLAISHLIKRGESLIHLDPAALAPAYVAHYHEDEVTEIRVERGWDDKEGEIEPKTSSGRRRVQAAVLRDHLVEHKIASGREGDQLMFGRTGSDPF